MAKRVSAEEFIHLPCITVDVRSPAEYAHARIPGAVNLPLFSDEERAKVGTCYKEQGKEQAVELGLEFVGPKLAEFSREAKKIAGKSPVKIHCWRGGMRSSSMAWLFETVGLEVFLLEGGYKSWRNHVRNVISRPWRLVILAGKTGMAKTDILLQLEKSGEQILDLEGLARHKGSSFGRLGFEDQPSTEEFENEIAFHLEKLDPEKYIWVESESKTIGKCLIPPEFVERMYASPAIQIDRAISERISYLAVEYGKFTRDELVESTDRIAKKLGGLAHQETVDAIRENRLEKAIDNVLHYYDKTYEFALKKRRIVSSLDVTGKSLPDIVSSLISEKNKLD